MRIFPNKNVFTEKFMQNIWKEVNATNGLACAIIEKSTEETMKQWLIDYGRKLGALKEEEISYICTYRIKKMIQ